MEEVPLPQNNPDAPAATVESVLRLQRILSMGAITAAVIEGIGLVVFLIKKDVYTPGTGTIVGAPIGVIIGIVSELRNR